MTFLAYEWFWLLLPLGMLLLYQHNSREFRWNSKRFWLVISMLILVVAMGRPVLEKEPIEVEHAGSDVIIAVDLSYSMQATDEEPTRLGAAKRLLQGIVSQNTKDRFGVIGFTTNAIILSPLTKDSELLLHLFEGLDENMIITKGTKLMNALELARRMSSSKSPKVLLLSDGGDEQNYADEALFAAENGLQVSVVMLGTRYGSTLQKRDGTLMKDQSGNIVVSAVNDAVELIADRSGGSVISGADLADVQALLERIREEDFLGKTKVIEYEELFYYFVALSLIAFMLAVTTLGKRLHQRLFALLMLVGIGAEAGVLDYYYLEQGRQAYQEERYERSAGLYGSVALSEAQYNAANSLYRLGEYEKALGIYKHIRSSDADFKAAVFFNMANCYIRLQEFGKAKEALRNVLILKEDPQAKENLYAISKAEEQDFMLTGRQEGKKREESAASESESNTGKKKKEGGGSNMDVSASASSGSSQEGKKVKSDPRMGFSKGSSKLSSRQYELINQGSVNEVKPW